MTGKAERALVPDPFEFGPTGALRIAVGNSGRLHLDRWLPFLFLHRGPADNESLARRIAANGPSYCLWSEEDDEAALAAIAQVAKKLAEHEERLMVVTLVDGPLMPHRKGSDRLPDFVAQVGASGPEPLERAATALCSALEQMRVDLRHPKVERHDFAPILPDKFSAMLDQIAGVSRISLQVPQIHRSAGGDVFPEIRHQLVMQIGDALLRSACAFLDAARDNPPQHYRSLGRSAYLAAALKADKKLGKIASSFDFLLAISPINTARAREDFLAAGADKEPHFHYRPLNVDPDEVKAALYALDLNALEDPLLETLLTEKRREVDAQLTMLATRNTPAFRPASMVLYGTVGPELLSQALGILSADIPGRRSSKRIGAYDLAAAAERVVAAYRSIDDRFNARIEVREDVTGLLVSRNRLMVGSDLSMARARLDALLAHEIGVHLLTYFNGAGQGLSIFATGLAGYEGIQEGLGVFAEWAVGGLSRARIRLLAGRVVAVEAMQQGAGFIDCYMALHCDHGFSPKAAFGITARVFRSGGLAKDAIYLQGFADVVAMVAKGHSLAPFWLGKIAPRHVGAIEELLQRGLVKAPIFTPLFLEEEGAKRRIGRLPHTQQLSDLLGL